MKGLSIFFLGAALSAAVLFCLRRPVETVRIRQTVDTVVVRDTVRVPHPVPQKIYIARVDTVYLSVPGDTVRVMVELPVERKEYRTDDYFAVVEGFRPNLVSMELFPQTRYITRTEVRTISRRRRFGVGIQAGYGISPGGIQPYVGLGVQYNIISW